MFTLFLIGFILNGLRALFYGFEIAESTRLTAVLDSVTIALLMLGTALHYA